MKAAMVPAGHSMAEGQPSCRYHQPVDSTLFLELSIGFEKYQRDLELTGISNTIPRRNPWQR